MPLNLTSDCTFTGPALPEPFVKFNLEAELNRLALLPKTTGAEAHALNDQWQFVRRILRNVVAHGGASASRLTCNHAGYAPLWREQLGEAWREAGTAFTWPVLSSNDARWAVRAAIDAVVAHAYGLTRDQYAHVLSTFSHSSYKDAPRQCLAAFDELQSLGLEAFTKKHDPYWYIPLNENLPQPVIDLPGLPIGERLTANGGEGPASDERPTTAQSQQTELFNFQTNPAPAGSGTLFTEHSVAQAKRRRNKT